jgi:hypothetical protein
MWNKRRLDGCVGHHWHVTGRGWSCCHCTGRVSWRKPAPPADPSMVCTDPPPPTSGLRKWVARLAPATPVPVTVRVRRPLALPAGPAAAGREKPQELERVEIAAGGHAVVVDAPEPLGVVADTAVRLWTATDSPDLVRGFGFPGTSGEPMFADVPPDVPMPAHLANPVEGDE